MLLNSRMFKNWTTSRRRASLQPSSQWVTIYFLMRSRSYVIRVRIHLEMSFDIFSDERRVLWYSLSVGKLRWCWYNHLLWRCALEFFEIEKRQTLVNGSSVQYLELFLGYLRVCSHFIFSTFFFAFTLFSLFLIV